MSTTSEDLKIDRVRAHGTRRRRRRRDVVGRCRKSRGSGHVSHFASADVASPPHFSPRGARQALCVFSFRTWLLGPKSREGTMFAVAAHPIEGQVCRGFEAVRAEFAENFARRSELGGACCAYHRGEKVLDLWGGI